jgi:hypothetical protein
MKNSLVFFSWSTAVLIALQGCVSVPGETLASTRLQHDVLQPVLAIDMAADSTCRQRKIANTEVLARSSTERTERWTVDRCGKLVPYLVTFSPDPAGGTNFRVRMAPE